MVLMRTWMHNKGVMLLFLRNLPEEIRVEVLAQPGVETLDLVTAGAKSAERSIVDARFRRRTPGAFAAIAAMAAEDGGATSNNQGTYNVASMSSRLDSLVTAVDALTGKKKGSSGNNKQPHQTRKEQKGEKPPPDSEYVCRICNIPGHWIWKCPQRANQGAKKGVSANETSSGSTGDGADVLAMDFYDRPSHFSA